jgi:hypothetical protein
LVDLAASRAAVADAFAERMMALWRELNPAPRTAFSIKQTCSCLSPFNLRERDGGGDAQASATYDDRVEMFGHGGHLVTNACIARLKLRRKARVSMCTDWSGSK